MGRSWPVSRDGILGPAVRAETARFVLSDPAAGEARYLTGFAPPLTHGDRAVLKAQEWVHMRDGRGVSLCGHGDGRGTGTAHAAAAVRECNGHESDRVLSGRSHCASARAPHSANGLANATLVAATKTLLRELASSAAHAACTPFAMGNAAILKPDVQTPIIGGVTFARLLEEAVLPYGVLHAAPSRKSPRKSGLQWTLRWREMDSNHRSLSRASRFILRKVNCAGIDGAAKKLGGVPMVRIHLPPAESRANFCTEPEGRASPVCWQAVVLP